MLPQNSGNKITKKRILRIAKVRGAQLGFIFSKFKERRVLKSLLLQAHLYQQLDPEEFLEFEYFTPRFAHFFTPTEKLKTIILF